MFKPPYRSLALPDWRGGREVVHVWQIGLDRPVVERQALEAWLSPAEQKRARDSYGEQACQRFIVARGMLRNLVGYYLQCDPHELQLVFGAYGKPEINPQQNKRALHFNLSHAEDMALFAFSWEREVGIDVEYLRPLAEAERIVARFFSEREQADFSRVPPDQKLVAFYAAWTRKEAYIKATGRGFSQSLRRLSVSLLPDEPARLLSVAGEPAEVHRWHFQTFQPTAECVAALAVEGQGWQLAYQRWDQKESEPFCSVCCPPSEPL